MSFIAPFPGGGAVKRTFLDHQHALVAAASSHTFSGLAFGSGGNIIACIETNCSSAFSSVTIGGITSTALVTLNGTQGTVGIFAVAGAPSGSQSVVANMGANATRYGVQIYNATTIVTSSTASSSATSPTAALNVPVGGAVIAGAFQFGNNATTNWTGATEDADDTDTLTTYTSASVEVPLGNASLTVTASFTASPGSPRGVFAVLTP